MYTGVMTFLSVLTAEEERVLYLGIPGLTWGAATVLGPIIGGAFTESGAGWRMAFYLNLFIGGLFAPVTMFLIPSRDPRPGARALDRVRNLDWVGLVLMSGIYVSGLMAISFGGVLYPWNSGPTIGLLVVGGTLTIAYWVQQACCFGVASDCRTIPFEFLRSVTLMYAFLVEACAATAAFVSISFLPLYFQFVRGDSALFAGVRLLPFVVFLVLMIVSTGWIATRIGRMTPLFLLGSALALAGGALMYTVDETTEVAKVYGYTILLGAGVGMYLQLPFALAQTCTKPALIPVAVGFISWAQLAAPAVTVAVSNAIFLNKATTNVAAAIPQASGEDVARIIAGVDPAYLGRLSAATRASIVSGIVKAMRDVYILVMVAGALSLLATVLMLVRGDKKLNGRALMAA